MSETFSTPNQTEKLTHEASPFQEGLVQVQASIGRFIEGPLQQIQTGERTGAYFASILSVLQDPARITIHEHITDSNFRSFNALNNVPATEVSDARLEISTGMLKERYREMQQRLSEAGIPLAGKDLNDLIFDWTVWHELGHGFEKSYENIAPRKAYEYHSWTDTARLEKDSLRTGIVSSPPVPEDFLSIIESERFAEGFSQMFIRDELAARGLPGIDADMAILVMRAYRAEKAQKVMAFITGYMKGERALPLKFGEVEKEHGPVNRIGYALAHHPEVMRTILNNVATWETQNYEERQAA